MDVLDFKISQKQQHPSAREIDAQSCWIVLLPPEAGTKKEDFAYLDVLKDRRKRTRGRDKTDTGLSHFQLSASQTVEKKGDEQ